MGSLAMGSPWRKGGPEPPPRVEPRPAHSQSTGINVSTRKMVEHAAAEIGSFAF